MVGRHRQARHPHECLGELPSSPMTAGPKSRPKDLRRSRRPRQHGCWDHLIVAPLVAYGANLGTLLRTCDAVGACMAVPDTSHYRAALAHGDTLPRWPHTHWVDRSKLAWVERERATSVVMGIELADSAIPLTRLEPARRRTVVLLGHERHSIPEEAWPLIDEVVEIPMVGRGASLNVAVAGSLVLYRLAGLA